MGLMSLGEGCIEMQRDTGTQRGEGHRKTGAEMGAIPLQAEAEGHGSLQGLLERLDSPSQPPDPSDSNFVQFKLPVLSYLFAAAPRN